mgnify:CR=1 FL=1
MSSSIRPGGETPNDFLQIDQLLTDEERLIRDTVREFVGDKVLPDIAEWFEAGTFPKELAKEMGALGLFGMHLEGYGCAGTNAVSYGLACTELEAGDSGVRSFVSVQGSLAMYPIWAFGSEEQKERWLRPMARGELLGAFSLTEADAGSDAAAITAQATRDGDGWRLNGSKMWVTNGASADIVLMMVRTDDPEDRKGSRGIGAFLVPTEADGYIPGRKERKMGLRGSETVSVTLQDLRLGPEHLIGEPGLGFRYALELLGKRTSMPPLGLLTVAAMFPESWELRLADLNVEPLQDSALEWADLVLTSTMVVQQRSLREVLARCSASGKPVAVGGPHPPSFG